MERQRDYGKLDRRSKLRLQFDWEHSGRILAYSVLAGLLSGVLACLAYTCFSYVAESVAGFYLAAGIEMPQASDYDVHSGPVPGASFIDADRKDIYFDVLVFPRYWILILLIPSFGGLVCGFLIWSFAPEANSESTDTVIRTFHIKRGFLRNRVPLVKFFASLSTLGSGGSAGWEGPVTLFGAGVGCAIAKLFRLNVTHRRVLLLAGAAGGLGAMFQIPFGGALFAVEVLYASTALEFSAIFPCLIASIVGFWTFRFLQGDIRILEIPSTVGIQHGSDYLIFLLFIPIIALFGLLFVRLVLELRNRFFRRLRMPEFLKPALGGLFLGCLALFFPQVLGGGYTWMHQLLEGQLPFFLILALIFPKMLATAITISSGGSGGLLAPSLLIGGLIGGMLGHFSAGLLGLIGLESYTPDLVTCVLVGMATFYAGIGKVPFTAAVIVCEMVGADFSVLVPLLLLSFVHIAIQASSTSLYEEQVLLPIDSEAHFGSYSVDLLRVISVREACVFWVGQGEEILTIPEDATIPETAKRISSRPDSLFPVVDARGRLRGMVYSDELWAVFRSRNKWNSIASENLAQSVVSVFPDDHLYKALRICIQEKVSEVLVVDPDCPDQLLGVLRQQDMIAIYNERLSVAQW